MAHFSPQVLKTWLKLWSHSPEKYTLSSQFWIWLAGQITGWASTFWSLCRLQNKKVPTNSFSKRDEWRDLVQSQTMLSVLLWCQRKKIYFGWEMFPAISHWRLTVICKYIQSYTKYKLVWDSGTCNWYKESRSLIRIFFLVFTWTF